MRNKLFFLLCLGLAALSLTGCTKRCRCIQYDSSVVYFSKEEVAAQNKTCQQMQYLNGMFTQYYSFCEWTYGD